MKPILLGLVLAIAPAAADTLTQLHKSFMERYDAANLSRDEQLKKLDASYLAALNREVEKAKATGKLDNVIPFLDEIQAVKTTEPQGGDRNTETPGTEGATATPGGNAATETPPALTQMRAKHAEAREKILKSHAETVTSLADKMTSALKTQESELTKAGKLDEALAAKHMRESLEKDEGVARSKELLGSGNDRTDLTASVSLKDAEMEIQEKGGQFVGWFSEDDPHISSINPDALAAIKSARTKKPIYVLTPTTTIRVKFKQPVRKLTTGVALIHPTGDLTISILNDGAIIKELKLDNTNTKNLALDFPATRELVIRVSDNGNSKNDWAMWIDPMAE